MLSLDEDEANHSGATKIEKGSTVFKRRDSSEGSVSSLENIYIELFPDGGVSGQQVVEIEGNSGTGKTLMLMEIMAKVLLPDELGGKDGRVLYVETDCHFMIHQLEAVMLKLAGKCSDSQHLKISVHQALERFSLYQCYSGDDLLFTIAALKKLLTEDHNVALIALDSISTLYYRDEAEAFSTDFSCRSLVDSFKQMLDPKMVFIYTKISSAKLGCRDATVDYNIKLSEIFMKSNKSSSEFISMFEARIRFPDQKIITKQFKIDKLGVRWIKDK